MIGLIASFSWVSPVGTKPGKPTAQALPVSLETGGTLLARGLFIREWPPDERFFRGCFENDRVIWNKKKGGLQNEYQL